MESLKRKNFFERSFDDSKDEPKEDDPVDLPEEERNIIKAINWKRRHFFVNCFFIAVFFMIKLEFSYTDTFGQNIMMF